MVTAIKKHKGRSFLIALALIVAAAVAAAAITANGGTTASADGQSTTTTTIPESVIQALTVKTVTVACATVVKANGGSMASGDPTVVTYNIGALQGTPPRLWSDALSTPLSGSNPQQQLAALQAAICEDPLLGGAWANMFSNLTVGGMTVGSLNPWLSPFAGDASGVNTTVVTRFMSLLNVKTPTQKQVAKAVKQNLRWQGVAERLDTLLTRFINVGDGTPLSTQNWHLAAGGLVVGGLPEIELNSAQEDLPALVFQVSEKGACAPLVAIGANLGDKRPEVFVTPTCPAPPATPSSPAAGPSSPPSHGGAPSTSSPPHHGTTTTTGPSHGTTTTAPSTTTTTVTPCTLTGKCYPPTTVPAPPTTMPAPTTTQPSNGGQGTAGTGATNTTSPPTTVAPAPAPTTTSSPPVTTSPPGTV